ncbi:MAG: porin [Myxococcales bacterium]
MAFAKCSALCTLFLLVPTASFAQALGPSPAPATEASPPAPAHNEGHKPWYEKFTIRGYAQLRYNVNLSNSAVKMDTDRSVGGPDDFILRRARVVLSGDPTSWASVYIQTDLAGVVSGAADNAQNFAQLRDLYGDIFLDADKEFRIRLGISKVPYGFENMQSSQNRGPFERSDALNSATPGERDIGVFAYWAPASVRKTYKMLVDSGLKGSGDYGVVGLGVYNGAGLGYPESNADKHLLLRLAFPFQIGGQILELNVGGYTGKIGVRPGTGTAAPAAGSATDTLDRRVYAGVILYPRPIGFQAEYNVGIGAESEGNRFVRRNQALDGGYVMVNAKIGPVFPYARAFRYDGGKKVATNSPHEVTYEGEGGVEVQIGKFLELTAAVAYTSRTVQGTEQKGSLARFQAQINY